MSKVIQMIKTSDENSIFITDFNMATNELSFRTSYEPSYLQKETIVIKGSKAITNLYNFSITFLNKFIKDNYGK